MDRVEACIVLSYLLQKLGSRRCSICTRVSGTLKAAALLLVWGLVESLAGNNNGDRDTESSLSAASTRR
jgi:hypothetical protein